MTYTERANQLALDSSVAVLVLMGAPEDVEFIPLRPRTADANMLAELKARWPGRNLRSVGVLGVVGGAAQCALKEPFEPETVSRLADAFAVYVHTLLFSGFAEQQQAGDFVQFATRLWSLPDPRLD